MTRRVPHLRACHGARAQIGQAERRHGGCDGSPMRASVWHGCGDDGPATERQSGASVWHGCSNSGLVACRRWPLWRGGSSAEVSATSPRLFIVPLSAAHLHCFSAFQGNME
ncbi:hypothetical protein E2562_029743 [Oryza meyeriana var. granulata]|uniref:Uncharacterized protein n=1 Tax=Oryza meyeriana var. granulata TaxID=110450 RepID=A0A6G1CKS1_9ORYZ|nr:hypothetical protein E2562_029743 [Oryza meyeriana var. granulata]